MQRVHIDADDFEVYANIDTRLEKLDKSFIVEALRKALHLLNEHDIKAVIFVVGKDLEQDLEYRALLENFIRDGHAIGNHSYSHSEDFHSWKQESQAEDLQHADKIIKQTLNYQPKHFRGPGYSSSHAIQKQLLQLGYYFDCTKIPLIYSSGLDLYFKITNKGKKRIPSFIRLNDIIFALAKPIPGMVEQLIHPSKIWGVPVYSTWIFQSRKRSENISSLLKKSTGPFLFHAIDFLDCYSGESSIPALRIPPQERYEIIKKVLTELKMKSDSESYNK